MQMTSNTRTIILAIFMCFVENLNYLPLLRHQVELGLRAVRSGSWKHGNGVWCAPLLSVKKVISFASSLTARAETIWQRSLHKNGIDIRKWSWSIDLNQLYRYRYLYHPVAQHSCSLISRINPINRFQSENLSVFVSLQYNNLVFQDTIFRPADACSIVGEPC